MATKKCTKCQTDIDENATKCPHCHADLRNWFLRHKILTGFLVFVGLIILLIALGSASEDSITPSEGNGEGSRTSEAEVLTKVGETVTDRDLAFTVTDTATAGALGSSFTEAEAQGTFHVITIKIENVGSDTKTIDSSMLQIVDSQGRTFDRSIDGQTAKGLSQGKVDLFLQQVQPGLSVTGDIVFDLPDDVTGLQLLVKGSMFSSGKKIQLD